MGFLAILIILAVLGFIMLGMELDDLTQLFVKVLIWGGIIIALIVLYEVFRPR